MPHPQKGNSFSAALIAQAAKSHLNPAAVCPSSPHRLLALPPVSPHHRFGRGAERGRGETMILCCLKFPGDLDEERPTTAHLNTSEGPVLVILCWYSLFNSLIYFLVRLPAFRYFLHWNRGRGNYFHLRKYSLYNSKSGTLHHISCPVMIKYP